MLYFEVSDIIGEVCKFYSPVFEKAVCGSEHPEVVDDRPTAEVNGRELDADLPGPRPLWGLLPPYDTR